MSETLPSQELHEEIVVNNNLILRGLDINNTEELFGLVENNRDYLGKWLPWVEGNKSPEDSSEFISQTKELRKQGDSYGFGLFYEGTLVGHASLMHIKDERTPEIGYWISENASGKGITTLAAEALTNLGLGTLGLDKIIIRAEPDNIGSNKVAEKLGYSLVSQETNEKEGTLFNIWEIIPR